MYNDSNEERQALLNGKSLHSYGVSPDQPSTAQSHELPLHNTDDDGYRDPGIITINTPWWKRIYYRIKEIFTSKNEDDEQVESTAALYEDKEQVRTARLGIKMVCMLVVGLLAVAVALEYLAFFLVPLALARFFVYAAQPLINYLVGKKRICGVRIPLPRIIAVTIVMVVLLIVFIALLIAIYFSLLSLIHNGAKYTSRFNELYQKIIEFAAGFGITEDQVLSWLPDISLSALAVEFAAVLYELIPATVLCLLFTIYMLLDYDEKTRKSRIQREIDARIRQYIVIKIVVSIMTGVLIGIILAILNVDMWFLFAMLTFLLNFIPNIGSMIAVLLPIPIALFDPNQQWWSILLVIILPVLVQFMIGNVLEPAILGTSMDMSAVSVLVCLAFWGYIWGIVGAFISVPLTVMIQMWFYSINHPMARFMAGLIGGKLSSAKQQPPL